MVTRSSPRHAGIPPDASLTLILVLAMSDFARGLADAPAIMDRGEIVFIGDAASLDEPDVRRQLIF